MLNIANKKTHTFRICVPAKLICETNPFVTPKGIVSLLKVISEYFRESLGLFKVFLLHRKLSIFSCILSDFAIK